MVALNKYKIEALLIGYWLIHVANTIRVSRDIGFVPKQFRAQAQLYAYTQPYPWDAIIIASIVLGISTFGFILILRKCKNKVNLVMFYSVAIFVLQGIMLPTDRGGVDYAIFGYAFCTLIIALCCKLYVSIRNRVGKTSATDVQ